MRLIKLKGLCECIVGVGVDVDVGVGDVGGERCNTKQIGHALFIFLSLLLKLQRYKDHHFC